MRSCPDPTRQEAAATAAVVFVYGTSWFQRRFQLAQIHFDFPSAVHTRMPVYLFPQRSKHSDAVPKTIGSRRLALFPHGMVLKVVRGL
jgi:hypothetical protein